MRPDLPFVDRARGWLDRMAIEDDEGIFTYFDLLASSERGAARLLSGREDLVEARVAFMVEPSYQYVVVQWSTWRAGGVAVPLSLTHPAPELEYVLDTTTPEVVVYSSRYAELLAPLAEVRGIRHLLVDDLDADPTGLPAVDPGRRAMILFTSGTTGRPKGVVSTHANLEAQIASLVEAWEWAVEDRILLTLPLHHVHGIVNVIGCTLWSGARCDMLPAFDATAVTDRLSGGELTLFMAVPTIYHRLIAHLDQRSEEDRAGFREGASRLRLMVSGSAALPVPVLERWRELSGHTLLERYGMTEIGMALSNPYRGERVPGSVGTPLPGVEVRLVDENDHSLPPGDPGEIQVRGSTVFHEYWERPDDTRASFTGDGWFRTGDTALIEEDRYRILGRSSVDILKTGGEKVSALEIEEVLLGHEAVSEVAVVGLDDPEWGQRVVAVVVARDPVEPEALRQWAKDRLASHKVPKDYYLIDTLPRNALGKTLKRDVVRLVTELE
ncbi:MAG TPA: acyl-CoA synthetase [Acidimicrobiia bacterium]|nr:acyl-CoA synthetase [Acidimicrobiia bacterium]